MNVTPKGFDAIGLRRRFAPPVRETIPLVLWISNTTRAPLLSGKSSLFGSACADSQSRYIAGLEAKIQRLEALLAKVCVPLRLLV